jgi:hypothetical protein
MIVALATGAVDEEKPKAPTQAQGFAWGGGLKGGYARADALMPEQPKELALTAVATRGRERG